MKRFIIIVVSLFSASAIAQNSISLQECYDFAIVNYPLAKQSHLLDSQNQLEREVISTSKLPQLNLDAQATYQSDVIEIPIPNSAIEPLNKDQYRVTVSATQLIYDGGVRNATLNSKLAQLKTNQKQVEINLYQLKQKINQLYFSILLSQETTSLLKTKEAQLQAKLEEVASGIKYGVLLPTSSDILKAEMLKLDQQLLEIDSNRSVLIETLSRIIDKPLDASTKFSNSLVETNIRSELKRPELELFQLKKEEIEQNESLIAKKNSPKLLGFATGGYGNPGLNMLDNSFQPFYIVGVKINWNVFDWNANKKQRESLSIGKDLVDSETETFKLNTNIELNQQLKEIEKIKAFIVSDQKIIALRKDILLSADSQLKNGIITSSAYITELTNLYEDENTLVKHKIQLQLARANYNIIQGH